MLRTILLIGILVLLAQPAFGFDLESARMVDLTHTLDEDTLYWPTSPSRFEKQELAYGPTAAGWFYSAFKVCTPEHGGTHLDAPLHFAENGLPTDRIPLSQLIAPAVVIDVAEKAAKAPEFVLSRKDVQAFEKAHGKVPEGAIVLLRTGWSRHWPKAKAYLGDDTPGDASKLRFPSYGAEAARLLVEERRVALLGVDTASIDVGSSKDFPVHRIAAARDVGGLENLTALDQLPATGAWVLALPLKIGGGSGGPARVVALVPES
ncbi:MAG: cyclase family protein [Acidobacteriota bacterium]